MHTNFSPHLATGHRPIAFLKKDKSGSYGLSA